MRGPDEPRELRPLDIQAFKDFERIKFEETDGRTRHPGSKRTTFDPARKTIRKAARVSRKRNR